MDQDVFSKIETDSKINKGREYIYKPTRCTKFL